MKKPLVSVLILTFNHTDFLKSCLDTVLKSDYPNLEFIVSDNGSKDDIAGFVKKNYSKQNINRGTVFLRKIDGFREYIKKSR